MVILSISNGLSCPGTFEFQTRSRTSFTCRSNVATLIGQTAKTLLPDREQVVAFQCNPHPVPISNSRENYSRPDGYGVYEGHVNYQPRDNHGIFWEFMGAPGEMKINNSDADINDVRDQHESMLCISDIF